MSKAVFTSGTVEIKGLDNTLNWLSHADGDLEKALKEGLKEAAAPVLRRARANAHYIQDDGTYAASLSLSSRRNGALYVIKSNDPAAGVKEFAHEGATRLVGPGAKSSTQRARKRAGLPLGTSSRRSKIVREREKAGLEPGYEMRVVKVGVPHRANPPRVMLKALDESRNEVAAMMEKRIADVLKEASNG